MRRRDFLATLSSAALLSGCSRIPTAGPVERVEATVEAPDLDIAPEPPAEGVAQDRLVEGFLQAMADPSSNYEVARQYLTAESGRTWDPNTGATIYDGLVSSDASGVAIVGRLVGHLDPVGRFTSADQEWTLRPTLVQEDGQWRIAHPPDGVIVSSYLFEREYSHVTTYFMARMADLVVPEMLHVPAGLLTPGRIISAQVAGPSQLSLTVARSAIPQTVSADASASLDASGVATVVLPGLATDLAEDVRRELGAQLVWSLSAIQPVSGIRVTTAAGESIALPGENADGVLTLASQQGYQALSRATNADLFGILDGKVVQVLADGGTRRVTATAASQVAVSFDGSLLALVDPTGDQVVLGAQDGALSAVETGLTALRFVQFVQNELWLVGDDAAGAQRVAKLDSERRVVLADTTGLPHLADLAISPTGTQAVAIVAGSPSRLGSVEILIGAVPRFLAWQDLHPRDTTGAPLTGFVAADWTSESRVAIISKSRGLSVQVMTLDAAVAEDLGPVPFAPVAVAALPRVGGDALAIRSSTGAVAKFQTGGRWTGLEGTFTSMAYPG